MEDTPRNSDSSTDSNADHTSEEQAAFEQHMETMGGYANLVSADLEAEYELLLSQRTILQPRFETRYAFSEVKEFGVGQGLTNVKLGLRLRYEIRREFAPYIGVSWNRKLGNTADLAQAEGGDASRLTALAGVRMWF